MATRINSASRVSALEIRTPAALAAIARKFTPVVLQQDDTPVPPSNADYFSRMMLPTNVELDSGNYATIDVQFDTRYIHNYILYHTTAAFPEMNIKGHPYVTPLSYAAYCFTLLYAHILACDSTFRPDKSYPAARFLSDADRKDLFDLLLRCHVPPFMADLFLELSPVYDPRRNNMLWCPSLAGYLHLHDFGRTLPPQLYYSAHHLLASTRTNAEPDDVLNTYMGIPAITYGTRQFTNSNYFGTWYANGNHPNFVNQDFFSFFNPLVGRALSARPTFARIPFKTEVLADDYTGNIYTTLLLASDENIGLSTTVYTALSSFVKTDTTSSPQLGNILATLTGTLVLSCSIEPPTLPTWTGAAYHKNEDPSIVDDATFAADHKLFIPEPTLSGSQKWLKDATDLASNLYGLVKGKHASKQSPYSHIPFDKKIHTIPPVLYFQPYDVSPSSLGLTIAAGIKIELAEIDGFLVPTEHPESSLDDNNSQYLQSAIRAKHIRPINSDAAPGSTPIGLSPRRDLDRTQQGIFFALLSSVKAVFPQFDNEAISKASLNPEDNGMTREEHHFDPTLGYNTKAGINGDFTSPNPTIWAWSSYRVVHTKKNPSPDDISFILSLRPIYGTNVTLSRSKHPSLLIPH
ncbi:capsid protein [Neurospora discreta partitivirus 4]|nr:capsid protein [Neurospora discreta partitivirus 4]